MLVLKMFTTAFISVFVLFFIYFLVVASILTLLLDYFDDKSKNTYSVFVLTTIFIVLSCYIVYMLYF